MINTKDKEFYRKRIADNLAIMELCTKILQKNPDSYVFCTKYIQECSNSIAYCKRKLMDLED